MNAKNRIHALPMIRIMIPSFHANYIASNKVHVDLGRRPLIVGKNL